MKVGQSARSKQIRPKVADVFGLAKGHDGVDLVGFNRFGQSHIKSGCSERFLGFGESGLGPLPLGDAKRCGRFHEKAISLALNSRITSSPRI